MDSVIEGREMLTPSFGCESDWIQVLAVPLPMLCTAIST